MVRRNLFSHLAWLPFFAMGLAKGQEPPRASKSLKFAGDFLTLPPPFGGAPGQNTFDIGSPGTQNMLAVLPFYLDRTIPVANVRASVTQLGTASNIFYYPCIYSQVGRLLTFGKIPCGADAALGIISVALSAPVTLVRGIYLFASGSDDPNPINSGAAAGAAYGYDSNLMNMLPGGGTAGNLISAGAPPGTLGTITEPYQYSAPYVVVY